MQLIYGCSILVFEGVYTKKHIMDLYVVDFVFVHLNVWRSHKLLALLLSGLFGVIICISCIVPSADTSCLRYFLRFLS